MASHRFDRHDSSGGGHNDGDESQSAATVPPTALCLKVPGTNGDELVVHRDTVSDEDYVFLFEALDDAFDYASAAEQALGFMPEIGRARIRDLHFRTARFKPATGDQVDLPLRR